MCKYKNIVKYLLEKIASGVIKVEQNMPTIRQLSEQFQCSKATVVRAYIELQQQHIVYAIPQSGYFLVNKNGLDRNENSNCINFASVSPDETILPYEEFQHCLNQAIDKYKQTLFNYSNAKGLPTFIETLGNHWQEYQVFAKPEHIFTTAGCQQALFILCNMRFPNNRTDILVEQPTYHGMLKLLESSHLPVVGIERSFRGIDLDELERKFATNRIKCFYTNPRFHHPLGTSLSRKEKQEILKLAHKYDVYILEDDYLADLEIKNNSYPIYYDDIDERVIYIKSFSKTLLPGLRVAAVALPEILINEFTKYKKWVDLGTSVLSQGALEIYIKCGMFHTHRKKIKNIYAEKMKLLSNKLDCLQSSSIKCHVPDTGFFACIEFVHNVNFDKLIDILGKRNIILNTINENYIDTNSHNKILKFSVSKPNLADINRGISIILDEIYKL